VTLHSVAAALREGVEEEELEEVELAESVDEAVAVEAAVEEVVAEEEPVLEQKEKEVEMEMVVVLETVTPSTTTPATEQIESVSECVLSPSRPSTDAECDTTFSPSVEIKMEEPAPVVEAAPLVEQTPILEHPIVVSTPLSPVKKQPARKSKKPAPKKTRLGAAQRTTKQKENAKVSGKPTNVKKEVTPIAKRTRNRRAALQSK
jgi:hypothetical protein